MTASPVPLDYSMRMTCAVAFDSIIKAIRELESIRGCIPAYDDDLVAVEDMADRLILRARVLSDTARALRKTARLERRARAARMRQALRSL